MSLLQRARDHYRRQRAVSVAAVVAARRQVQTQPADAFGLARVIGNYQLAAATLAGRSLAAEAGRAPYTNPIGFVGRTTGGIPLTDPVQTLLDDLTTKLEAEAGALSLDMLAQIDRMVASEVAEAGRAAGSVEIVADPYWENYVRVLNPPSCSRCAILAGRIYRDNEGFLRHPLCDCVHWPVESWEQAHDEGLVFSAKDAFTKGEIRGLSKADTAAINAGADISAVVNAAQGMYTGSIFGRHGLKVTRAGTTKKSEWRQANPDRPIRLRPESIYDLAKDRDDEIRLLKLNGFIKADADVPTDNGRAGGSGGGGRPPAPPTPSPDPGPDPTDWAARKAALGIDFGTDRVHHHEIEFYERFKALGHDPAYIRHPPKAAPSNDFVWRNNGGIEVEVKSNKPAAKTVLGSIEKTVRSAIKHPWAPMVKENFIVDIGTAVLTPELRADLERYNTGRMKYRIARLWVMSESGRQLDEVHLA